MPIRPEMKARYPKDWKYVRARIQTRAGNKCEWCRVPNLTWVIRLQKDHRQWLQAASKYDVLTAAFVAGRVQWGLCRRPLLFRPAVRVVCTTAHVHDRDPANCADDNLAFLCQLCHNRHDARDRAINAARRRSSRRDQPCLM